MKKLLIANCVLLALCLAGLAYLAWNQQRLDDKYNARYEVQKLYDDRQFQVLNHILMPDKYPLPTAVSSAVDRERAPDRLAAQP